MRTALIATLLLSTACVPKAKYHHALGELEATRQLVMIQQDAMAQMEAEIERLEDRAVPTRRPGDPVPVEPSNFLAQDLMLPALSTMAPGPQAVALGALNNTLAPCKLCADEGHSVATCLMKQPACGNTHGIIQRVVRMANEGSSLTAISQAITYQAPWIAVDGSQGHSLGPAGAPVTIVMFLEVQCPYCVRGSATIDGLRERYGDQLRVVYKHFPLAFHQQAKPAAIAMEAAANQGRFWEYRDALYARANELRGGEELLHEVAQEVGLNLDRFRRDLDDPATTARVDADMEYGASLGVSGTPAFYVNGYPVRGAQPESRFAEIIDRELER
jgi:protein-disulfide isomerase